MKGVMTIYDIARIVMKMKHENSEVGVHQGMMLSPLLSVGMHL